MLPARVRLALAVLVASACAALAGVWVAASRGGSEPVAAPGSFAGALRPPGLDAPPLDGLRDADGRPARMSALRGTPVVMTFLYSTCEDTCPAQTQAIRGALDSLGHDVPVLAVSVDPANDTPRRAERFLVEQRMTGRMRFLLGTRSELSAVWKGYAIAPQREDLEHSAHVVLVDAEGRQRVGWPADRLTPEGLAHDIEMLLREAGEPGRTAEA